MYWFNKEMKEKLLKGRKIKYMAENIFFVSPEYLISVLNGKRGCSIRLAKDIRDNIDREAEIGKFFYKKGE